MKHLILILLLCAPLYSAPAPIPNTRVAVLYNSNIPESKSLAQDYAIYRKIPASHLIGLPLSPNPIITHTTYQNTIRNPLAKLFTDRNWWTLGKDSSGLTIAIKNQIRVLVVMKGVPLKIKRDKLTTNPQAAKKQFAKNNEASLDSELTLLGVQGYDPAGFHPNQYYRKNNSIINLPLDFLLLVGRIDSHSYENCDRMMLDALDAEENGLWGQAYLDLAKKGNAFQIGDDWIEDIHRLNTQTGIPTYIDRRKTTLPGHYPIHDAALYFGWYAHNKNGPFLDKFLRLKKGAIAVHLHSYSAKQLTDPDKNWSAPILAAGAAATLGNVFEPYLGLTHNFNIFHQRLIEGYTLIEAAYMSLPCTSWQAVVLGDPLYRPYAKLSDFQDNLKDDRDFKTLRLAQLSWASDEKLRLEKLHTAAAKLKSAPIYEALGLQSLEAQHWKDAEKSFRTAAKHHKTKPAQIRQYIHLIEMARLQNKRTLALQITQEAQKKFPNTTILNNYQKTLDPPPPPPAKKK